MTPGLVDLVRLARAGQQLDSVFIVGEARCGTTLLYRLLQQQPAFGPDPVQLVESGFLATLLMQPDLDDLHTWSLRSFLGSDEATWARFVRAGSPLLSIRQAVLRRRPYALSRPSPATAIGVSALAQAYIALAADARRVSRLVEKTTYHTPFTAHLLRWFPKARMLYLIRHPVDVLTSYWRRAAHDKAAAPWASIDVETFVDRYATNTALATRWAAERPDAFMVLRYEELVAQPENVLATVSRFVGAEFDPRATKPVTPQAPDAEPLVWTDVCPTSKDWRHFIDEAAAAAIERRLAGTLLRLGYQPYAS